jgi:hypothetical protein
MSRHDSLIRCRDMVRDALLAEAKHRNKHDDWVDRERLAVAIAANNYAQANGLRYVTTPEVEEVESLAVGHVDYADKLAFYVSELVHS